MRKTLITGVAGFIGFHLSERLLKKGFSVFAYDDLNTYYDVKLKESRLNKLYEVKVELNAEFLFRKGLKLEVGFRREENLNTDYL